jgi:arginine-tRNA-protein transferase
MVDLESKVPMETLARYLTPPGPCGYLPERIWQLEYEHVSALGPREYLARMNEGWRRFGTMLFRPRCRSCSACQSLRVLAGRFHADRSQRRVRKANEGVIQLRIGAPSVTRAKLDLYDRYHAHQAETKGWPFRLPKDVEDYANAFVENPFSTREWCYYLDGALIGVGYVDDLPGALSAIYFYYDPSERSRSLGTWNVLCLLEQAAERKIPYVYLGYYIADCPSMSYKSRFCPNQLLGTDGVWQDFRA